MLRPFFVLAGILVSCGLSLAADPDVLQLGIVDSLVKDLDPGKQAVVENDLTKLVKDFTGLKNQVLQGGTPSVAAKNLAAGKWHLAVLQGIEYAWLQSKDPKIQPILVASGKDRALHALLVVKKDAKVEGFADLKGKDVVMLQNRESCRLFADKEAKGKAKDFFGKLILQTSVESALDDVLLEKVQAAIVDNAALEIYKEINPGRYDRLKIAAKSEQFPDPVFVCYQGTLSDGLLTKFRTGLLKANQTNRGREIMDNFNIAALEAVPASYAQVVTNILKTYPAPE